MSKVCAVAICYGVSNRAAAAISTAALSTAKDAGLINDNAEIVIDQNKIAKDKLISEGKVKDKLHNTSAIYFDGRKDLTKVLIEDENGNFRRRQIREDHYSICSEPGGNYLGHLTICLLDTSPSPRD